MAPCQPSPGRPRPQFGRFPELPCRDADAVVPGSLTTYRIPLVTNARRFAAGHQLRLVVTSDDQDASTPAIMGFRHAPVGTSSLNTIHSSSTLVLPVATRPRTVLGRRCPVTGKSRSRVGATRPR